ncbi:MAG: zinc-binding dehydrogenase [Clostridia bacterium]|nr:zinc-binding dehydrogenase [Clostridia bacterium]
MNVWKLTDAEKLTRAEEPLPEPVPGKLKVRVTKVLLCDSDIAVLRGSEKIKYPIIPGCFAIGIIAEEGGNAFFPKGTRVVLHAFLPAPDTGTAKKDFSEDDYLTCGRSCDGFMRDIVYLSPDEMTALPDSVGDEQALLLHHVAFAKATVDILDAQKGQHIAVVGANILGILISQLLIYQQTSPMLVDAKASRLNFARNAGIYYTALADEDLLDNIGAVTGGRLADGTVFVTGASGNDPELPFSCCRHEGRVVVTGLPPCDVRMDLNTALRKQLTVECISNCADYLTNAINLFAQKAVNIDCFTAHSAKENEVGDLIRDFVSREERDTMSFDYIKLL